MSFVLFEYKRLSEKNKLQKEHVLLNLFVCMSVAAHTNTGSCSSTLYHLYSFSASAVTNQLQFDLNMSHCSRIVSLYAVQCLVCIFHIHTYLFSLAEKIEAAV